MSDFTNTTTPAITPPCGGEVPTPTIEFTGWIAPVLKFKKVHPAAVQPTRAHPTDSGLDLVSVETLSLAPGAFHAYDTGIQLELPAGFEGQVRPRSGLAAKKGITVLNAPGTIDTAYTGNVKVILINHGPGTVDIKAGDRIAQLVIAPVSLMECVEVKEVTETDRGANGLGSTGV
jgi:dUTP pyrophosphatase